MENLIQQPRSSPWPPKDWGPCRVDDLKSCVRSYTQLNGFRSAVSKATDDVIRWECAERKRLSCPVKWCARRHDLGWCMEYETPVATHTHDLHCECPDMHLMHIGMPEPGGSLDGYPFVSIPYDFNHEKRFKTAAGERLQVLLDFAKALGPSFLQQTEDAWYFHQSFITTALATLPGLGANLMLRRALNWDDVDCDSLRDEIIAEKTMKAGKHSTGILVIFVTRTSFPNEGTMTLSHFYDTVDELSDIYSGIHIYPSRDESFFSDRKVGDIKELDRIALNMKTWRPKTCVGMGQCTIPPSGNKTVSKRTSSCGAGHVETVPAWTRDPFLRCRLSPEATSKQRHKISMYRRRKKCGPEEEGRWFHQEYVKTFDTWGELRVFIAGDGIGAGRILGIVHTRFTKNGTLEVHPFTLESLSFLEPEERPAKYLELRKFVLEVVTALQASKNPGFASLDVGCRIDVGISELSTDGKWFGGEVVRWWAADFFSHQHLRFPHLEYCQAFADGFRVSLGLRVVNES